MTTLTRLNSDMGDILLTNLNTPAQDCTVTVPVVSGKSAYDLAVENGYVGSLQDWLASLSGWKPVDSDFANYLEQHLQLSSLFNGVNSKIEANKAELDARIEERISEAQAISTKLDNEAQERIKEANELAKQLLDETTQRVSDASKLRDDLQSEAYERALAMDQLADDILSEQVNRVNEIKNTVDLINQEVAARSNAIDTVSNNLLNEQKARQSDISALVSDIDSLDSKVNSNHTFILENYTTTSDATTETANQIKALKTTYIDPELNKKATVTSVEQVENSITNINGELVTVGNKLSGVIAESGKNKQDIAAVWTDMRVRVEAESALSTRIDNVIATTYEHDARIVAETKARTDADSAMASDISAMSTRVGNTEGKITTLEEITSNTDSTVSQVSTKLDGLVKDVAGKANASALNDYYTKAATDEVVSKATTKLTAEYKSEILDSLTIKDTRDTNELPKYYWANHPRRRVIEFKWGFSVGYPLGNGGYGTLETTVPWNDSTGGAIQQVFKTADNLNTATRHSIDGDNWSNWKSDINDLTSLVNTKASSTALSNLESTVNRIDGKVIANSQAITSLEGSIETVNNNLSTKASGQAVSDLTNRVIQTEKDISSNSNSITTLNNTVDSINGDLATRAKATAVSELSNRVDKTESSISSNSAAITTLNNSVSGKADSTAMTALSNRVTDTEAGVVANTNSITHLTNRVGTTEGKITGLEEVTSTTNSSLSQVSKKLDNLVTTVDGKASSQALSDVSSRVTAAEGTLTSQGQSISKLTNDLDTTNNAVNTKASADSVSALTNRVSETEGKVTSNSNALTALTNRVTTTEGDIAKKADASVLVDYYTKTKADEAIAGNISTYDANLRIGGSNLYHESLLMPGWLNAGDGQVSGNFPDAHDPNYYPCKPNEKFAGTFYDLNGVTLQGGAGYLCFYDADKNFISGTAWIIGDVFKTTYITAPLRTAFYRYATHAKGVKAKLEYGTKATDWSPSDIDIKKTIDVNASAISGLSTRVDNNEGNITSQGTSINNLQNSISTINNSLSTKADSSALSSLDNRVTSIDGRTTANANSITSLQGSVETINGTLTTKANSSALNNYYTKQDSDSAIAGKISEFKTNYVLPELGKKFDASAISAYYNKSDTDSAITSKIDSFKANYVDTELGKKFNASAINNYFNKAETNQAITTATTELNASLAKKVNNDDIPSIVELSQTGKRHLVSTVGLDVNTYYPVCFNVDGKKSRITMSVSLGQSKASWATHGAGWSGHIEVTQRAGRWGSNDPDITIERFAYYHCAQSPVIRVGQIWQASKAIFYLRGGTEYFFYVDNNVGNPELYTSRQVFYEEYGVYCEPIAYDKSLEPKSFKTEIQNNASALTTLKAEVKEVDGKVVATASRLDTVSTTVGNHTASIQQHAESIDGIKTNWTLKLNANGRISGMTLMNDGRTSEFAIEADNFYVGAIDSAYKPFQVKTVGWTGVDGRSYPSGVYINNAVIADLDAKVIRAGTITADKLAIGTPNNLVSNFSKTNSGNGWVNYTGIHSYTSFDGTNTPCMELHTQWSIQVQSDKFKVDPAKSYEFTVWLFSEGGNTVGSDYIGINAFDNGGNYIVLTAFDANNPNSNWDDGNPYFWIRGHGDNYRNKWVKYTGYVLAAGTDLSSIKGVLGLNVDRCFRFKSNTDSVWFRILNYYNDGTTINRLYMAHPTVREVDTNSLIETVNNKKATSNLYYPGTTLIDGGKIQTDSITADRIQIGSLGRDRLDSSFTQSIDATKTASDRVTAAIKNSSNWDGVSDNLTISRNSISGSKDLANLWTNQLFDPAFPQFASTSISIWGNRYVKELQGSKGLELRGRHNIGDWRTRFYVKPGEKYHISFIGYNYSGVGFYTGLWVTNGNNTSANLLEWSAYVPCNIVGETGGNWKLWEAVYTVPDNFDSSEPLAAVVHFFLDTIDYSPVHVVIGNLVVKKVISESAIDSNLVNRSKQAKQLVDDIISDNKITPDEKQTLLVTYKQVANDNDIWRNQAYLIGLDYTRQLNAANTVISVNRPYLGWVCRSDALTQTDTLNAGERTTLMNAISEYHAANQDLAQRVGSNLRSTGQSALSTANTANSRIDSLINEINNDNILTATEKSYLYDRWLEIVRFNNQLNYDLPNVYGDWMDKSNQYDIYYNQVQSLISNYVSPNLNISTDISSYSAYGTSGGAAVRETMYRYYAGEEEMRVRMTRNIKGRADNAGGVAAGARDLLNRWKANGNGTLYIDDNHIAVNKIGANEIAAGAINADHIYGGTITGDKIKSGAITANKISVTSLDAISANLGSIKVRNANIGEAEVDTLNIRGQAVTVTSAVTQTTFFDAKTSANTDAIYLYTGGVVVAVEFSLISCNPEGSGSFLVECYVNDVVKGSWNLSGTFGYYPSMFFPFSVATGTEQTKVHIKVTSKGAKIGSQGYFFKVTGLKR